jgi:general secretion pathway protein L
LHVLDWSAWISGARAGLDDPATVDLCQYDFAKSASNARRQQAWHIPAALAAGLILVQLIGMNAHWLMLRQQKAQLTDGMAQTLRHAFPNTPVIVDAPLQMQRQVEQLRLAAGKTGPDDFLPLADRLAQATKSLPPDGVQTLEYKGKTLHVTLKSGVDTIALRESVERVGLTITPAIGPANPNGSAPAGATAAQATRWTIALAG